MRFLKARLFLYRRNIVQSVRLILIASCSSTCGPHPFEPAIIAFLARKTRVLRLPLDGSSDRKLLLSLYILSCEKCVSDAL